MIRIIKNTAKILLKRKSFLITTFLLPIILIFAFTAMNNSGSTLKIAVVNKDSGEFGKEIEYKISNLAGVTMVELENEDYGGARKRRLYSRFSISSV